MRSRSMLDGCGIETGFVNSAAPGQYLVAIDARWLWNRDWERHIGTIQCCQVSRSMLDGYGIETTPPAPNARGRSSRRDRCSMAVESRPPVAGPRPIVQRRRDRCSMAVESRLERRLGPRWIPEGVAIDARWLWNRDFHVDQPTAHLRGASRSMLDGCGIETAGQRTSS